MVDEPADPPETGSSATLWAAAIVFSLVLHAVCMAVFRSSRLEAFGEDAAIDLSERSPVKVSVRDALPEIDPGLFPELFPESVRERPDETLERMADAKASLEDSVPPFALADAGEMAWMPDVAAPEPKTPFNPAPPEIDPGFPEDPDKGGAASAAHGEGNAASAAQNASAKKAAEALRMAMPAVAPEEIISRISSDTAPAPQPSPVTAGTVSDVFKAALEAAGEADGAGAGRSAGWQPALRQGGAMPIALPDPFEMAEKPLADAARRGGAASDAHDGKDAQNGKDALAQAAAGAALDPSSQGGRGAQPTVARDGAAAPLAGRAIPMPQVDEAFVARERAAVEALKDSQEGSELAGFVSVDFAAYTDPAEPQWRYFKVSVANRPRNLLAVPGKDLVILIDTSASIGTPRLAATSAAIAQVLEELHEKDRFNLVSFADNWTYAFDGWQENTAETRRAANKWTQTLRPRGWTDVFSTISSILTLPRDPSRPLVALVITDGDATKGVYKSNEILSRFTRINGGLASIYFYGVVEDANAYLMDILGMGNRGGWARHRQTTAKRSDPEDKKRCADELPAFARTFSRPVMSDFSVVFSRASRAEAYPRLVSNLYIGKPVEIWGRCPAASEDVVFELRGLNGANVFDSFFRRRFRDASRGDASIKTEWAKRKISHLTLEYAATKNPATLAEMHRLADATGIEIPYEKEMSR